MKDEGINFKIVMVIDDNLIDLYIASRVIISNNFGKKVLQYSSGFEALKFLRENQENLLLLPHAIFVDIYMPEMNGFEFLEEYDKLPTALKQHCKVYIISSSRNEQDVAKAGRNMNILSMEEKPITKELLHNLLN